MVSVVWNQRSTLDESLFGAVRLVLTMGVPLNLFMIISQSISQSLLQRQQPETANINIIPPSATELFEGQMFSVLLDTIFTQTQIQRGYTHILDAVAEVHTPLAALSLASNK